MSRAQLKKLFYFATSESHFLYKGQYYDQIDGVAMGSPLGPVLANLFMGYKEKIWLKRYKGPKVNFYRRYVDDIFCMFDSKEDAYKFLEYLNNRHDCIKFTIEEEEDGKLPFLDVLISKIVGGTFHTTTYRKPTNTGLLTNFTSFCSYSYKIGLIKTLVDRAYKINSDLQSCTLDHKYISTVLQKNLFPLVLIKRVINEYMARAPSNNANEIIDPDGEAPVIDKRYYKLPYLGEISPKTNRALIRLIKKCCTEAIEARFVFDTSKIGRYFSAKDHIPKLLRSHVVYHFTCTG